MLRDQLRERHEQHERGLKEDLELRHQSSKASLMRRREMRRRSVSQSPSRGGGGSSLDRSNIDLSPLQVPPSNLPGAADAGPLPTKVAATAAAGSVESAGPDLTVYKKMKSVRVGKWRRRRGGGICN